LLDAFDDHLKAISNFKPGYLWSTIFWY